MLALNLLHVLVGNDRPTMTHHHKEQGDNLMYIRSDWHKRIILGAAGGFIGTLAVQALLTADRKWLPHTAAPLRQDPGEFMVETVEERLPDPVRQCVPQWVETGAARMLAVGYGLTCGVLYTLLRPKGGSPLVDGVILGIATWAAGYLGWLPALGLMPPVWQQKAPQAIAPIAEHALYGMTTVATYDWLRERVEDRQSA
jgi:hypothetical protein